jgi:hypothetical protein
MARKEDPEVEFIALVDRLHGSGDLRVFIKYLTVLRDDAKYQSYDPDNIKSPHMASNLNGQQFSYDHILEIIQTVLRK